MELPRILRMVGREVILIHQILRASLVDLHIFKVAKNGAQRHVELTVSQSVSELVSGSLDTMAVQDG